MNLSAILFQPHEPPLAGFNEVRNKVYAGKYSPDEINLQYLLHCLLVYDGEEPVARLCLYNNPAIGKNKTLLFGNLECINDAGVFEKLMTEAEAYAHRNGYAILLGPINGTTWDEYRLPLINEGRQFTTDLPQPLYYADYLLQNSFEIIQRYYTKQSRLTHQETDELLTKKFQQQGIIIRSINMTDFDNELHRLYPFCIKAFSDNVYYSAIDQYHFIEKYKKTQPLLNPEFVLIAENNEQEMVAFLLCFPDVYQSQTIVMKTMARSNEPELRGLMTFMVNIFYNRAVAAGYTRLLHSFFHEKNRSGLLSEKYNGQPFKSYGLFQKNLLG